MTITATSATSTTAPAPASAATGSGLVGSKDEFLKLFMAQLQHQDPLSPQNATDMTAQLAQFSAVEQATQTNQHLTDLATATASSSNTSLAALVGRTCNATAGNFQLDASGAPPPLAITANGVLKGASVVIADSSGTEIRRIPIADGVTSAQIRWDGNTKTGAPAAPGSYHVSVDAGTTTATITAQWAGRIDAVELTDAGSRLRMGDLLLTAADIRTIGATTPTPSTGSGITP